MRTLQMYVFEANAMLHQKFAYIESKNNYHPLINNDLFSN